MKQAIVTVITTVWFIHVSYRAYHWVGFSVAIILVAIPLLVSVLRFMAWRRESRLQRAAEEAMRELLSRRTEARIGHWFSPEGDNSDDGIDAKLEEFVSSRPRIKSRRMGHRLQNGQTPPDKPTIQ